MATGRKSRSHSRKYSGGAARKSKHAAVGEKSAKRRKSHKSKKGKKSAKRSRR